MNLIVAVDENWGIGNQNELLIRIPADHKFFREETTGKVVVIGRKTLETFPQKMPLAGRTNIILSTNQSLQIKGAKVVNHIDSLLKELEKYSDQDIYVAGGGSVYRQLLPYCNVAHVTKIEHSYAADTYFPNLDDKPEWQITADSEEQTYFDICYRFIRYERLNSL